MDKKLTKALNEQIKNEFYSAYLYLAMAAYFETKNLPGFAHWMKVQFKEEQGHGMKIYEFVIDRGDKAILQSIPQPPAEFSSPLDVFEETLKHEKKVTALLNDLYRITQEVKDNAAGIFLQWFISEQVEEEKNAVIIVETLKVLKPDSAAIIMLDRELAKRQE